MIVVTTAPSYLFWRCAPPELRVPQLTLAALAGIAETTVAVGPHGSSTPRATLRKLGVDAVVIGECEEVLVRLAETPRRRWGENRRPVPPRRRRHRRPGRTAGRRHDPAAGVALAGRDAAAACASSSPLRPAAGRPRRRDGGVARLPLSLHLLRQGEFPQPLPPPPARDDSRRTRRADRGRRRPTSISSTRFSCPGANCSKRLAERPVEFGVQTRIDLWRPDMLDLLGAAGCVSIEAGVESLSAAERDRLDKDCRLSTDELTERLVYAKRQVPFVQANLIATGGDDPGDGRALARGAAAGRACGPTSRCRCFRTRLAGLSPPLGAARRRRLGAGARLVSRPLRRVQRHPGGAAAAPRRTGADVMRDRDRPTPLTVLMTADAVGGVWHYALGSVRRAARDPLCAGRHGADAERGAARRRRPARQCRSRRIRASARMDAGRGGQSRRRAATG